MKYIFTILLLSVAALTLSAQSLENEYKSLTHLKGGEKMNIRTTFTRLFSGNKVKTVKILSFDGDSNTPEVKSAFNSLAAELTGRTSYIRENSDNDNSFIFMNPLGNDVELLIMDFDKDETGLVFLKCSQSALSEVLDKVEKDDDKD